MFFKNSGDWNKNMWGSLIGNAPPIWQDIAAAFCADGSVKPTHKQADRPFYGDGPGNRPTSVVHCDDSGTNFTDNLTP
ncbi:hypothetical protein [Streptomyces sp. NRRL S-646]|uniref:hypothetical protein n=1 Tax=Streptomyces sp. NRRL S-646 TaxID=1463917 RepID=UPI0004CBA802|nr:hypothetical protein [Streptomyces sp. NRRL S-646]